LGDGKDAVVVVVVVVVVVIVVCIDGKVGEELTQQG